MTATVQSVREVARRVVAANRADATIHVLFPDGHAHRHNAVPASVMPF